MGQGTTHGRILKPAPVTAKFPADRPSRIRSAESSATTGLRSAVAPATGFGGLVEHLHRPPLPWRAGNAGSEGAQPPASLRQGTHGVWPHGVSWLRHN